MIAPHGYNLTYGGEGSGIPCQETRLKMSESHRGKKRPPFSKIHRSKISESLKKSKRFKASRRKNSEDAKRQKQEAKNKEKKEKTPSKVKRDVEANA